MSNSRREFVRKATLTGAAAIAAPSVFGLGATAKKSIASDATEPFKLRYAPGFGLFREHAGTDIVDNIKFCYDKGFRAMFDNGLPGRSPEDQVKMGSEMQKLGMLLGPFVAYADFSTTSFVLNKPDIREMLIGKAKEAVEVAKRSGAKWALMVPGRYDEKLHRDYQTSNVIDNLRYLCDIVEPAGLTIVLEPLNMRDHPGLFLTGIPQSYAICRALNRPSCKIVNDIYHQQITEGNLIPNIEAAWSEIGAFHCGDNPGRKEPGTGEINYRNVFKSIYSRKYDGVICMEHGKSVGGKEGEIKLLQAYRDADNFEI
jgi:hydroxypyruvate isomerase